MDYFTPPARSQPAISVAQLLRRMKNLLEQGVGEVWVEGEVSNLKKQASGHWYFSLKDVTAQIQCAMFGARKRPGCAALLDGAKVRVLAEASVYEARGQLQIIVREVELAGAGDLLARFEALKRKLQAEGLFDASRKQPIPQFPRRIGIVTSPTGAALQDILNVLGRRAPWVQPVLMPVRVQGKGAELEIARAIDQMAQAEKFGHPRCDVLIVGRGGGSLEDLWNFNEEVVARAIAACPIPVISAVGHEIDFTIADFVADLRAPTPSAAAEMAVADGAELAARFGQWRRRLDRLIADRIQHARLALDAHKRGVLRRDGERLFREPMMRVDTLRSRLTHAIRKALDTAAVRVQDRRSRHHAQHPARVIERRVASLELLRQRLIRASGGNLDHRQKRCDHLRGLLRTLGPESAFQRGFSITLDAEGKIVRSVAGLAVGTVLRSKWLDGEATSQVTNVRRSSDSKE